MKNSTATVNQRIIKTTRLNFFWPQDKCSPKRHQRQRKTHKKQDFSILTSLTIIVADHYTLFLNFVA